MLLWLLHGRSGRLAAVLGHGRQLLLEGEDIRVVSPEEDAADPKHGFERKMDDPHPVESPHADED